MASSYALAIHFDSHEGSDEIDRLGFEDSNLTLPEPFLIILSHLRLAMQPFLLYRLRAEGDSAKSVMIVVARPISGAFANALIMSG